jgi:hypothetical protein
MISDSASGRSNGVRLTSAMLEISKIPKASRPGGENTNQPCCACFSKIVTRLRLPAQSTIGIVESTCGISYETSCATERIAPSSEYLFRLDHPARKIPSGERLETATRYTIPEGKFTGAMPTPNGITARTRNAETRINTGASRWTH